MQLVGFLFCRPVYHQRPLDTLIQASQLEQKSALVDCDAPQPLLFLTTTLPARSLVWITNCTLHGVP